MQHDGVSGTSAGRRSIAIVNGFGDSNFGGAAITLATGDLARRMANGGPVSSVPVGTHRHLDYLRSS